MGIRDWLRPFRRVRGVQAPGGVGFSWDSPLSDFDAARELVSFLENRRVLYQPIDRELPQHCIDSVIEIRNYCTDLLARIGDKSELHTPARLIRVASRTFCDSASAFLAAGGNLWIGLPQSLITVDVETGERAVIEEYENPLVPDFDEALQLLRGEVGAQVQWTVRRFDLGVEWQLASIFPDRSR